MQVGSAAAGVGAVGQSEIAAVGFRHLPAEYQSNSGASLLGGEKGDEEVGGIGNPRTIVLDKDIHALWVGRPADAHAATGLQRGVDGIANQVDEHLLDLVGIHVD